MTAAAAIDPGAFTWQYVLIRVVFWLVILPAGIFLLGVLMRVADRAIDRYLQRHVARALNRPLHRDLHVPAQLTERNTP